MTNRTFPEIARSAPNDRMDLWAFIGAFLSGLILYVVLRVLIRSHVLLVVLALVGIMLAYALLVTRTPRLRVRLDQAADNAYYLGLLFTLISMAFALYQFGDRSTPETGIEQIIKNFGIGLATTITGIFLRVVLHQMRLDPADIEGTTRIELAEASKGLRASLDLVTTDLGRFHDEVRQRNSDLLQVLSEQAGSTLGSLHQELQRATKDMVDSHQSAHQVLLGQMQDLTRLMGTAASEAVEAITRLRAIEPPPLALSRRLDKLTSTLDAVGHQTEAVTSRFQETADCASSAIEQLSATSSKFGLLAQQLGESHNEAADRLLTAVDKVGLSLGSVGERLEHSMQLLHELETKTRDSAVEASRAQTAAVEVLTRLTDLTRGLTQALKP